ncbi:MAG: hypothetical protein AMXMBFR58_03150 [Phycisphaerae bacterium]
MDTLVSLCVGLGLAAACGFRVFFPLALMSWSAKIGMVDPSESFAWVSSWPAIVAFSTACVAEVAGYYIPWVDHALDTVATPAAIVAGSLVAVSQFGQLDPMLGWSAGIIGGGGLAGAVQGLTVLTRAGSTATTAGIGNPVVATAENGAAATVATASIISPIAVGALLLLVAFLVIRRVIIRRRARAAVAALA